MAVLYDKLEAVSAKPVQLPFLPHQVRAARRERLCVFVYPTLIHQVFDIVKGTGNRRYIITARRMILGLALNSLNGLELVIGGGFESPCPFQSEFF